MVLGHIAQTNQMLAFAMPVPISLHTDGSLRGSYVGSPCSGAYFSQRYAMSFKALSSRPSQFHDMQGKYGKVDTTHVNLLRADGWPTE